ncbi:hypothetical protein IWQ56_003505, partial [Coemansia nantahalensis]
TATAAAAAAGVRCSRPSAGPAALEACARPTCLPPAARRSVRACPAQSRRGMSRQGQSLAATWPTHLRRCWHSVSGPPPTAPTLTTATTTSG